MLGRMKPVVFGNPRVDWWKIALSEIDVSGGFIALEGELQAGFFHCLTPMCIPVDDLSRFATELREFDRTLKGSVTLASRNEQSAVTWTLTVDHVGHVQARGRYEINGNGLDFTFCTDQTQISVLFRWMERVLDAYRSKEAQPSAPGNAG
jgi:hypothetical protein